MNVPFLVKQYLSNDLEQGSFSKIFWYYPLKKELADKGGIGMFFEVLYGDVEYEVYEQLSKRFWDTFSENYYELDFEQALRKSIQTFTQMLRGFGVEDGLDVNIVLFNAIQVKDNGYALKIIAFGESDVFVVRDKKVANIVELIPSNKSLKDVKFLELDLEDGDVLMLSNKTLLQNAFDSEFFNLESIEEMLSSMEQFKDNLFGSKKVFLIAALPPDFDPNIPKVEEKPSMMQSVQGNAGSIVGKIVSFFKQLGATIAKYAVLGFSGIKATIAKMRNAKPGENIVQEDVFESKVMAAHTAELEKTVEIPENRFLQRLQQTQQQETQELEPTPGQDEIDPLDQPILETIEQVSVTQDANGNIEEVEVEDIQQFVKKEQSVDEILKQFDEEPELPPYNESIVTSKPTNSTVVRSKNYADEFINNRSAAKKVAQNEYVSKAMQGVRPILDKIVGFLKQISGGRFKNAKIFIGKNIPQKTKLWPVIVVIIIVLIGAAVFIQSNLAQADSEKKVLAQYDAAVTPLSNFYDQSIVPIISQDPNNDLDVCLDKVTTTKAAVDGIKGELKAPESKTKRDAFVAKLADIDKNCTDKYDRLNSIVRVKTAELVTDFKVSLGSDSRPVDMTIKQNGLIIADAGRKAIYLLNPANSSIVKYEDPSNLISSPVSVGAGETSTYVCDKNNGVVYADDTSKFSRIVGLEPAAIGECAIVKGFAKNVYVVPAARESMIRATRTKTNFDLPTKYIEGLKNVRDFVIDGNIYIASSGDDKATVWKFYAGKQDTFTLQDTITITNPQSAYTNPSDSYDIYIYDKDKNRVVAVEKPKAGKHPGVGIASRTIVFDNKDMFSDIKDIVVDLKDTGETNMYILNGSTVWKVALPRKTT